MKNECTTNHGAFWLKPFTGLQSADSVQFSVFCTQCQVTRTLSTNDVMPKGFEMAIPDLSDFDSHPEDTDHDYYRTVVLLQPTKAEWDANQNFRAA
jgi:hypothetical protein